MSTRKVWLEVALNGPWTRAHQPNIPITTAGIVAESLACIGEGASIVHVHAYDERTGRQRDDANLYADIIDGVRSKADAIVYPTVPFAQSSGGPGASGGSTRFDAVRELGERGLLECSVVDLGSLNMLSADEAAGGQDGFVHTNSVTDIRENLALGEAYGFTPSLTIYEPGFLRSWFALRRAYPRVPAPIYRFMLTDHYTFGFSPTAFAVDTYRELLAQQDSGECAWMVAGLGVSILPILEHTVQHGGHIRVGLEDLPPGSDRTNVSLVSEAARLIRACGAELATADEVRVALRRLTDALQASGARAAST